MHIDERASSPFQVGLVGLSSAPKQMRRSLTDCRSKSSLTFVHLLFPLKEAIEVARLPLLLRGLPKEGSSHRGDVVQGGKDHLVFSCFVLIGFSAIRSIDTWPVRVTEKLDRSRCQRIHNQSDSGVTRLSSREKTWRPRSRLGIEKMKCFLFAWTTWSPIHFEGTDPRG